MIHIIYIKSTKQTYTKKMEGREKIEHDLLPIIRKLLFRVRVRKKGRDIRYLTSRRD